MTTELVAAQARIAELEAQLRTVDNELANDPRVLLHAKRQELQTERNQLAAAVIEQDRNQRNSAQANAMMAALTSLRAERVTASSYLREELPRIMAAVDVLGDGPAKAKGIENNLRSLRAEQPCDLGPYGLDWEIVRAVIDRLRALMNIAAIAEGR